MFRPLRKTGLLATCLVLSVAVHTVACCALGLLGNYDFGAPVGEPQVLVMNLADLQTPPPLEKTPEPTVPEVPEKKETPALRQERVEAREDVAAVERGEESAPAAAAAEPPNDQAAAGTGAEPERGRAAAVAVSDETDEGETPIAAPNHTVPAPPLPERRVPNSPPQALRQFASATDERLTYQITMLGVPVGRAELEAKRGERGTTITLRVKSNPALSSVYPVDNTVETQHVDGRFLMTRIRQQEGAFRSDEVFSINLQQKRVSWTDNINYRRIILQVPSGEVLDTLSGIYSLRTRPLQVGRTETLHIFDSETYSEVPVEIMRREKMRLPNLSEVDALVVRPLQKTAGIFRRTGEILIWLTDDAHKVPVKIVTTIAIGKVTAELVASESREDRAGAEQRSGE